MQSPGLVGSLYIKEFMRYTFLVDEMFEVYGEKTPVGRKHFLAKLRDFFNR